MADQDVRDFLAAAGRKGAEAQKKKVTHDQLSKWGAKGVKIREAKRRGKKTTAKSSSKDA
jgi:hypothetical protein